jgi:sugar lactone lactonase YvrE/plastocyanin
LGYAGALAIDPAGNLYIADAYKQLIRKVDAQTQYITAYAGYMPFPAPNCQNAADWFGDGCPANDVYLNRMWGVGSDATGNIYIGATVDNRVLRVDANTQILTTVAGDGVQGYSGDGFPATSRQVNLNYPMGVAVDSASNVYFADSGNYVVRMVAAATGIITTVAGNGTRVYPYGGDGGLATNTALSSPQYVAFDAQGNLYISDLGFQRVFKVGLGLPVFPPTPVGTSSPPAETILLSVNSSLTIGSISIPPAQGGKQEFVVGTITGCTIDGQTIIPAQTVCTVPVTFQPGYPGLRQAPLVVQTSAGNFQFGLVGTGTAPKAALLPGTITTVAGNGSLCADPTTGCGDGTAGAGAQVSSPYGVAMDSVGNVYIADESDNRVRKVDAVTGTITTVAGNGTSCSNPTANPACGDGGAATAAQLNEPMAVAVDAAGNLYIADLANFRIRRVDAASGAITTVAGTGSQGYYADMVSGAPATSAALGLVPSIALDSFGNLFIVDEINNIVRKVSAATGLITTVAGTVGPGNNSGDGGPATSAQFYYPTGVAVDGTGNLYISDYLNDSIRKVDAATQTITTLGNANSPRGIAVDSAGNVYVAARDDSRIAKWNAATGAITTIAGTYGSWCSNPTANPACGDGGAATSAQLDQPYGVAVDGAGNLYIADTSDMRIRKVDFTNSPALSFPGTPVGQSSATQTVGVANIGNATLNLTSVATATSNFKTSSTTSPCLPNSQLEVGATCSVNVYFQPSTVGAAPPDSVTFTDNSLNVTSATQSVALLGSGQPGQPSQQTITFPNPGTQTYGAPVALQATASSGLTVSYTVTSGSATINGSTLTPTGVGQVKVTAAQAGNSLWLAAPSVLDTFNVNPAALTVTADNQNLVQGQAIPILTATISGFVNGDSATVVTGTANCTTAATSSSAPGTYPIACTAGTLAAVNYSFTFVSGILTITASSSSLPAALSIASLTPVVKQAGSPGFTLSVTGTGFTNGSVVQWNGSARTTTFIDSQDLTATIAAADISAKQTVTVTVQNPDGTVSPGFSFVVDSTPSLTAPISVTTSTKSLQVAQGKSVTMQVSFTNATGAQVSGSCLNLPAATSCTYDDPSRTITIATSASTPKDTYQVVAVFVVTTQQAAALRHSRILLATFGGGLGLPFGLLWVGRRGRKRQLGLVVGLAVFALVVLLAACGGSSNSSTTTAAATGAQNPVVTQVSVPVTLQVQ